MQCEPCSCFRYGETWAEQFRKVNGFNDDGGEETLDLRATESITTINGCSWDDGGYIVSLQAETTTGASWGPVGYQQPDYNKSLRPSPGGKIKLAFISGREEDGNYCVRCQLPPIICYNLCLRFNRATTIIVKQIKIQNHHRFHLSCKRRKYILVFHPLSISPKSLSLSN